MRGCFATETQIIGHRETVSVFCFYSSAQNLLGSTAHGLRRPAMQAISTTTVDHLHVGLSALRVLFCEL